MALQVRDRVRIIGTQGKPIATGTIVNINNFREPESVYAVDVDDYNTDVLFFNEQHLIKIENEEDFN